MNRHSRTVLIVVAAVLLAGCDQMGMNMPGNRQLSLANTQAIGPTGYDSQPGGPSDLAYLGQTTVADIHQGEKLEGRGGVDIAMEWSSRYAEVTERLMLVERDNRDLLVENQHLQMEIQQVQAELAAMEQELSEANQMLVDLHQELDSWKRDVLSFRDEMRRAQAAQLNALQKVLRVLGGDVPTGLGQPTS